MLAFGGVRAIDGVDLDVRQGQVHGLIGPNGSGKTTTLNVISGYYRPEAGCMSIGAAPLPPGAPEGRAARGIARTYQTPRLIGEATVLENVMIGATICGTADLRRIPALPAAAQARTSGDGGAGPAGAGRGRPVGAGRGPGRPAAAQRAALHGDRPGADAPPGFLLLDEPAAGLSAEEIKRLGALIRAVSRQGTGVLLVEHHADLIFDICDQVTVLNLGKVLAAGTPAEIRVHKEVVSAYLGA